METVILDTDGAVDVIRQRLMTDWLIVDGDLDAICQLEECVYPPGTELNAGFEIIGFLPSIHLAQKTDRLRELLGNPVDFDRIQILTFGSLSDGSPGVLIDAYNPDVLTKEEAVNQLAATARDVLESGRQRRRISRG